MRGRPGNNLDNAVLANAERVASRLRAQSPILQDALEARRLRIIAARYDLSDGSVRWFERS